MQLALVSFPDGSKKQKVEMAPEDEIDEEEQLDQQFNIVGPHWHARFWDNDYKKCLGIEDWGDRSVGPYLGVTISCAGMAPVFALRQILPPGMGTVPRCTLTNRPVVH